MLKLRDLALRSDFDVGCLSVSPSRRRVTGPGGEVHLEPLIMQVFLLLLDADGRVVTRNDLFDQCWGGVMVGDDSLNRAIGKVRRIASDVAPGFFEIETIPRTGYRLTGPMVDVLKQPAPELEPEGEEAPSGISRRALVGGSAAAAAAAAAGGLWWTGRRSDAEFDALIRNSEKAIRAQSADQQAVRHLQSDLQTAVRLRPRSAKAWGLTAYVKSGDTLSTDPAIAGPALDQAQSAARRALAIDPKEPYALLALYELQGSTLDWAARDRRLRQIIAIDPTHLPAIAELVLLTQAAGLNRESWNWNERAISLDPFSFDYLSKRALKLWIAGRTPQADKVIDQVMALYPGNPWPRYVRFLIYAMTERPRAARIVMENTPGQMGDPASTALWRTTLTALDQRSPAAIAAARQACIQSAEGSGSFAVDTAMILCALREVDAAFDVANGFLLSRGSVVTSGKWRSKDEINDATWRINTQYLFTPPCKLMRADPRFLPICKGMGLTDYWRARGVRPDYQLHEI